MADTIWGNVTKVIDGDTFEMNVTHISKNNQFNYNPIERIRLAGGNAPELSDKDGQSAKNRLKNKIDGKNVKCIVQSRDVFRRLVADVSLT